MAARGALVSSVRGGMKKCLTGLFGNVAPTTHRNTYVAGFQCRAIIDTVTGDSNRIISASLDLLHNRQFLFRGGAGKHYFCVCSDELEITEPPSASKNNRSTQLTRFQSSNVS
jgi:hypothetical protein